MQTQRPASTPLIQRAAIGVLVFLLLLIAGLRTAHAVEVVPAIGISQMADGEDHRMFLQLGLRTGLLPRIQTELAVGYRREESPTSLIEVSTVPVTLSVWASPVPALYAGGGVGAYYQVLSYDNSLAIPNESETQFGAHLGGGLRFPLAPMAKLELGARYVFLGEQATGLAGGAFDPSFWSATAGLAIGF